MEITEDRLLGGRVIIRQPKKGYRVAIDPLLLAASVKVGAGSRVLDLGVGTGAASLCLAARVPGIVLSGVDSNASYLALAHKSATLNGLSLDLHEADVGTVERLFPKGCFDAVMANPPYYEAASYSPSPDTGKNSAHAGEGGADAWVGAADYALKPGGVFYVVFPAEGEKGLRDALKTRFKSLIIQRFLAKADGPARRVIIAAMNIGEGIIERPPAILHDKKGGYTEEIKAVLWDAAPFYLT